MASAATSTDPHATLVHQAKLQSPDGISETFVMVVQDGVGASGESLYQVVVWHMIVKAPAADHSAKPIPKKT